MPRTSQRDVRSAGCVAVVMLVLRRRQREPRESGSCKIDSSTAGEGAPGSWVRLGLGAGSRCEREGQSSRPSHVGTRLPPGYNRRRHSFQEDTMTWVSETVSIAGVVLRVARA